MCDGLGFYEPLRHHATEQVFLIIKAQFTGCIGTDDGARRHEIQWVRILDGLVVLT